MGWFDRNRWWLFPEHNPAPLKANFDDTGVTQVTKAAVIHIGWSEIIAIYAYKRDCFSVDQLRLEVVGSEKIVLCTEAEQDFEELEKKLHAYLPNSLPGWHLKLVTSPAFELTWTQVYSLSTHVP